MLLITLLTTLIISTASAKPTDRLVDARECYAVYSGMVLNQTKEDHYQISGLASKGCQSHVGGQLIELTDVRLKIMTQNEKGAERTIFISSPTGVLARDANNKKEQIAVSSHAVAILDGLQITHNGLVIDTARNEIRSSSGLRIPL